MDRDTNHIKANLVYPFILVFVIIALIGTIFVFEIRQTVANRELSKSIGELSKELQINSRDTMTILRQARKNEERIKELEAELKESIKCLHSRWESKGL